MEHCLSHLPSPLPNGFTNHFAADVGKIAYQEDSGTYWRLTAVTPTWKPLNPTISIVEIDVSAEDADVVAVKLEVYLGDDLVQENYVFRMWLSDQTNGLNLATTAADGGFNAADGNLIEEITTGKSFYYACDDTGSIWVDVQHSGAMTVYLAILLPDGTLFISSAITFA